MDNYTYSQRLAYKLGDIDAFGADPRRVAQAGHDVDNAEPIDFGTKYKNQNDAFKARYDSLGSKFNGKTLDDYINGQSFCCSEKNLDEIEKNNTQTAENAKLEDNLYFYHPDHLGSTSMVTNYDGEVTQNVAYIPYGEIFVEERNGSWASPFLFNAKEMDEETGLYYYGARYLDPKDCRWLAVDPVFHPGSSPYAYCLGNPVKLVDPKGKEEYYSDSGKHLGSGNNAEDKSKYVISDKADLKTIKKNTKAGGTTDVNDLNSAYKLPSDAVLEEALNVLERTKANGGVSEETSLVAKNGNVYRGAPGSAVIKGMTENATGHLPHADIDDSEIEASIHSHPTTYFFERTNTTILVEAWDASMPSDYDELFFPRFSTNLIVGKKGDYTKLTTTEYDIAGNPLKMSDNRSFGVAFFGRNSKYGSQCDLWLSESAMSKILKK